MQLCIIILFDKNYSQLIVNWGIRHYNVQYEIWIFNLRFIMPLCYMWANQWAFSGSICLALGSRCHADNSANMTVWKRGRLSRNPFTVAHVRLIGLDGLRAALPARMSLSTPDTRCSDGGRRENSHSCLAFSHFSLLLLKQANSFPLCWCTSCMIASSNVC